jgi:hypothetical protein
MKFEDPDFRLDFDFEKSQNLDNHATHFTEHCRVSE